MNLKGVFMMYFAIVYKMRPLSNLTSYNFVSLPTENY